MLGNNKNVPREKNGLILVPEASVKLVVRAIKIMIGRKVFSGAKKKTSLAATNRIEKQPIKWVEFFRNINCEGDLLVQNSSLRTKA